MISRHIGARAPTETRSTSGASVPGSRSTSMPPIRPTAGTAGPTAPLEKRTTVGASVTSTASRSWARTWSASRGAASLSPGTT